MYKKVSTDMNFVEREKQVEKFWEDNQIFEKSMKVREGNPSYVFYDGPPTANGKPHIGHVETRVIKDMIPRYRTMKGYQVPRKAGWDTHGLPVELEVEKKLGLDGKDQIEKYGVEPFIEQCKESVWKYEGMWEDFSHTVGFWADMKNPYVTYHNDYIESEWWALKEIWKKGLLYEGHKIVPYCPRCGTPLSSHEVAQGYKDVKERSAVVRFKVKGEDAYILAWTTTPWTLPSNVALCVNPDEDYVKVTSKGYTYYMAAALVDTVLGEGAEVLELPSICTVPVEDNGRLYEAFEKLDTYQWIIFTSPAGVEIFFDEMDRKEMDVRSLGQAKIAAIGEGTKKKLKEHHLLADFVPGVYDGDTLGAELAKELQGNEKILIPRAEAGNKKLTELLEQTGAKVDDIATYTTCYEKSRLIDEKKELETGSVDCVVFTSASTVKGFVEDTKGLDYTKVKAACIGKQTKAAADAYGMQTRMAKKATIESLIELVEEMKQEN